MGLHSSRARYARGKAVPRFWYADDATAAIPEHVLARESMQSGLADAVRYEHMTVDSLKLLCKRRQLKVSGTKHELIRKLLQPLPADRVPLPHPPPATETEQGSSASGRIRGEQEFAHVRRQRHDLPSLDFVPSQLVRDLDRTRYERTSDTDSNSAVHSQALSDDNPPLSYREGQEDSDEDDEIEVAKDHDTPWTVMNKKEMHRVLTSPRAMRAAQPSAQRHRDVETRPAQRPQRVIAEADFERVLGKRKAEELQTRHQQAQLEPALPAAPATSLRFACVCAAAAPDACMRPIGPAPRVIQTLCWMHSPLCLI
eukprot:Tamp_13340.p1 GENE.Tamp_13340~~Tamp_13340.p1  ORF type:complete len:313 (+),score=40.97 Tamp_13340:612-1550(+)